MAQYTFYPNFDGSIQSMNQSQQLAFTQGMYSLNPSLTYNPFGSSVSNDGKGGPNTYVIVRSFIQFDTSSIPDDETISSASLRLTAYSSAEVTANAYIWQGSSDPLQLTEFSNYGALACSIPLTVGSPASASLSGAALAAISKTGKTGFCVRNQYDSQGIISASLTAYTYSAEDVTVTYRPMLTVNTSTGAPATPYVEAISFGMDF